MVPAEYMGGWLPAHELPREQFEHLQHVVRVAFEQMDLSRFTDSDDEAFWLQLRDALLAAGATATEIRVVVTAMVRFIVSRSDRG